MKDSEQTSFYITTTLPYVNANPHMGHALEFVQADVRARAERLKGVDVFFNTGTDEHGQKVWQKAEEAGKDAQEYVDEYAANFKSLKEKLDLSYDSFMRTTDPRHKEAAQEFWRRCDESGDIYKKMYESKYCVGCEMEKTDSDLVEGRCPLHPDRDLEIINEENYFFRFSKYQDALLELYARVDDFIIPAKRKNELVSFVESGLHDFSISRQKSKMPWGVPVPGDDEHVMYVWFDALVNYISALGWPNEKGDFEKYWVEGTTVQCAGKDNLRQQAAIWQAMLMSAGLPTTRHIFIHGFITSDGQKMSKSIGNVVDPLEIVRDYGTDALRYYLLRHVHASEDGDFTGEKFKEAYNAGLANGLGNLLSRVQTMRINYDVGVQLSDEKKVLADPEFEEYFELLDDFEFQKASDWLWEGVNGLDGFIAEHEPYKLIKEDEEKAKELVAYTVVKLYDIAVLLGPLLPETSAKMKQALKENEKPEPLFERR